MEVITRKKRKRVSTFKSWWVCFVGDLLQDLKVILKYFFVNLKKRITIVG